MGCNRCNGWMASERCAGPSDEELPVQTLWRCVNCGEIVDAVIMENREHNQPEHVRAGTVSA